MNRKQLMRQGAPRHEGDAFSRRHPPMSTANRAKIFAPFAALTTYDAALRTREAVHAAAPCPELSDDAAEALGTALKTLFERLSAHPSDGVPAALAYFEPFAGETGYVRHRRGRILSANLKKRTLTLTCQNAPQPIAFAHLLELHFL
ncbi:hypothetical protein [uncultured Pseudoramibacter sp.]|uniref:hypothetical protein n=1 Tax=uncultured Pseudoramibacter sp. TaxID=1623493 RepID=UPI0025DB7D15|nr:hypothetical protein [uncultured Pseudoramibacter sp.]